MVDALASFGRSALHVASKCGHKACAETLLAHGADPNRQTPEGYSPLHFAAKNMHLEVAELLVSKKAFGDLKTKKGETPLDLCAWDTSRSLRSILEGAERAPHSGFSMKIQHARVTAERKAKEEELKQQSAARVITMARPVGM